jgi:predicted dehydrogenase
MAAPSHERRATACHHLSTLGGLAEPRRPIITQLAHSPGWLRPQVALVGCGYWGVKLCRVLAQSQELSLRWVCDTEPSNLRHVPVLAPDARCTDDLSLVLSDPAVTAVIIATPVASHHAIGMAALGAGKHVLVEKPLAATVAESEELCAAAEAAGRVLMVGHIFLYNPAVQRVRQMIRDGELGDVRYIFCRRLNLGIVRRDVDVLWDLASHDVSILDYWVDRPVERVAAFGHSFLQPGIADLAFAHLTFAGNVSGHIQVTWLDPAKVRQATVVGSRKMLVYDDVSADAKLAVYDKGIDVGGPADTLARFDSFAQHQLTLRAGDVLLPHVEFSEPLAAEVSDFSDGLRGLRVVRILNRLRQDMLREGGVAPATALTASPAA